MNEHLHFFEEAADDIEEARRWYRERSELAERAFLHEVDRAVDAIVNAPDVGVLGSRVAGRTPLIASALALIAACPAAAQQVPAVEVSGGYIYLDAAAESHPVLGGHVTAPAESYSKGWYVEAVANVNSWLGIVGVTDA